ncbi:hypothetical protein VOLCADRAFT_91469 [Volvox carteri f. nagariensis]|uniref:Uncharacterized protein n=1 Tax=Volvox carteri f. nagariensis TaxID=3068 RepID=D8TX57_VOLCA|nr:uncharacterized protein VOLCADRAFT_91469 [Volvox carteri f. nagariensis]EFJ47953.1 hypothetical protein VOLCADRAFT_91469 [Volvox carteri f. nagariensis]|eukprot:XP_002951059.1 hypothetical protein VOLCADRAFT_91469 [Volvox carteri f. nagariensis]
MYRCSCPSPKGPPTTHGTRSSGPSAPNPVGSPDGSPPGPDGGSRWPFGIFPLFRRVWEEGVSSEPAALRLYGKEICTTLCEMLSGQQWGRKTAAAAATTKLTEIAPDALGEHGRRLAAALLSELSVGRLWEGKEAVLAALAALVAADPRVMEAAPGYAAVVDAMMAALARKKTSYRTAALAALEVVLRSLPGSQYDRVAPPLLAAVARHCEAEGAAAAAAGGAVATSASSQSTALQPAAAAAAGAAAATGGDEDAERPLPLSECLSCLAAAFARVGGSGGGGGAAAVGGSEETAMSAAASEVSERGGVLAAALRGVLAAQLPWPPKLAAAAAVQVLAQLLYSYSTVNCFKSALDHKVQQFRLAAIGALGALVQAAAGSAAAPQSSPSSATPTSTAGWNETDRRELLPGLVSGLQQLADVDRSAAVVAAALGVKAALEPLLAAGLTAAAASPPPPPSEQSAMDTAL